MSYIAHSNFSAITCKYGGLSIFINLHICVSSYLQFLLGCVGRSKHSQGKISEVLSRTYHLKLTSLIVDWPVKCFPQIAYKNVYYKYAKSQGSFTFVKLFTLCHR